jgi:hypothetical protein
MPMTNPVVAETKVTDPGSKPLGTGDPAGTVGLGAVVVDGATAVVVVLVDLLVLVVVVRRGALVGDELHDAAQTARTSTAITVGRRRRSGVVIMQSIVTRRMPPEQGPKSLLRGPLSGIDSAERQNPLLASAVSGPPSKVLGAGPVIGGVAVS